MLHRFRHQEWNMTIFKQTMSGGILGLVLALTAGSVPAQTDSAATNQTATQIQDRAQTRSQTRDRDREQIYGSQLMTLQERAEYHRRLRALKTEEEREQFRLEHHARMQERAKAKGLTLPEHPPADRPIAAAPRGPADRPAGAGPRGK